MSRTIFDRLIAGELPVSWVYQDAVCVAFMDLHPMSRGHVLVVPRRSRATMAELDAVTRSHLWDVATRVSLAQQRALGSRAQHLLVNDGKAASQTVPHVHIHVIPRYGGDAVRTIAQILWHIGTLALPHREDAARRRRLDALAEQLRAALAAG